MVQIPRPQTALADDGLPHCQTCRDLRRVRDTSLPVDHPQFGVLLPCPECGHLAERQRRIRQYRARRERIERYSQKRGRYARQTFASFDLRRREREAAALIRKAYRAAQVFAEAPQGWLVLHGPMGTGKSHLAAAVVNHLEGRDGASPLPEEERPLVLFLTAPDLLDLLRSGYRAGDYEELLALCREVDVMILDDLGAEQETDWATEKLFQVLNHRYQAELPTLVVTNSRLENLDPRLYDRLCDDDLSVRVEVLASTYRQRESAPGRIVQAAVG